MNIFKIGVLCFLTVTLMNTLGCGTIPYDREVTKSSVLYFVGKGEDRKLDLEEPIEFESTAKSGGKMSFNLDTTVTLLPGEYVVVAVTKDSVYYVHKEKGIKIVTMGLTDHLVGGIKIPNDNSMKIQAWARLSVPRSNYGRTGIPIKIGMVLEYPLLPLEYRDKFVIKP